MTTYEHTLKELQSCLNIAVELGDNKEIKKLRAEMDEHRKNHDLEETKDAKNNSNARR